MYIKQIIEQNTYVVDKIRLFNPINRRLLRYYKLEDTKMSKSKIAVPEAKKAMENFKMEAANEVGVTLKPGYNGDLTSKQAGSIGGQMVKRMIEDYENKVR